MHNNDDSLCPIHKHHPLADGPTVQLQNTPCRNMNISNLRRTHAFKSRHTNKQHAFMIFGNAPYNRYKQLQIHRLLSSFSGTC